MKRYISGLYRLLKAIARDPHLFAQALNTVPSICAARAFSRAYVDAMPTGRDAGPSSKNPLWQYFQGHRQGHGIWKWEHYFDIYHRHFAPFVGQTVKVLEIGVYSGGSLEMWHSYFGEKSRIYGVDIEEACKAYENDHVSIAIGDQADRAFWRRFREGVDGVDILIDDGGHTPEQQRITLEEMLPHLRPGGVYWCEDVHGQFNRFAAFAAGLVHELNVVNLLSGTVVQSSVSPFQSSYSMHFYPYLVVIEKRRQPLTRLSAPKHGTEWQPFL